MSVTRINHNRENPYVQINKGGLWDENLPLAVVGLWARCLSRPDNWEFNTAELAKSCGLNIETIQKYFRILIKHGYAFRIERKNKLNQFQGYDYIIFEFKLSPEEKMEIQKKFPQRSFPCTEKLGPNKEERRGTKKRTKNGGKSPKTPSPKRASKKQIEEAEIKSKATKIVEDYLKDPDAWRGKITLFDEGHLRLDMPTSGDILHYTEPLEIWELKIQTWRKDEHSRS